MPRFFALSALLLVISGSALGAPPSPTVSPTPRSEVLMTPTDPAVALPPTADDIELAKAHYKTGEIYYDHGRYPDAAHEFEEAYRLSHRAALLYNMGKSYDAVGDSARALIAYRRFLEQVPNSPDRPEVEKRVAALVTLVGRVEIHSTIDGSTVRIDGIDVGETPLQSALELNPGGHLVEVAHEGYATWHSEPIIVSGRSITIEADPKSLVKVEVIRIEAPAEKPKPVYKKWWLWTIVGVVIVGGAVAAAVLTTQGSGVSGPSLTLPGVRAP